MSGNNNDARYSVYETSYATATGTTVTSPRVPWELSNMSVYNLKW